MIINGHTPKYLQLVSILETYISTKTKSYGEKMPSVAKTCRLYKVSRDTVLLAFDILKKRGLIYSIVGKGYFVKSLQIETKKKIFILFDELNAFKEELYVSLMQHLGKNVVIDIYFHHFNAKLFQSLIEEAKGNYSSYIIMPSNLKNAGDCISLLNKNEVYLLDQTRASWKNYSSVFQDFEKDMFTSLLEVKKQIDKYNKLVLIFPGDKEPHGMVKGFLKYCELYNVNHQIESSFKENLLAFNTLFIVVKDEDLVNLIETANSQTMKLKKHYGIISYNDIPLKKIVEKGITTISTNFKQMGQTMAEMILLEKKMQVHNPCNILIRNSL